MSDIVLNKEETRMFIYNMLHPNEETIKLRDNFIGDIKITMTKEGEIISDVNEIVLLKE